MLRRLFKPGTLGGILFVVAALLLLSGCATQQVVVEKEYLAVTPEDHMLVNCAVDPPPLKKLYIAPISVQKLTIAQAGKDPQLAALMQEVEKLSHREQLMTAYSLQQLKNIQACNVRLQALRDWKVKAKETVRVGAPPALTSAKE